MPDLPWFWLVAAALWVEFCIKWPHRLPHPIVALGMLIGALDRHWNLGAAPERTKKIRGIIALILVVTCAAGAGLLIQYGLWLLAPKWALPLSALIGITGLAAGSLFQHVKAIHRPLADNDLPAARHAVSMIVGRDTETMDVPDIATAALESLAESLNDGVVAPVFWFCLAGLPGLFAYKAINTADSMIGHMEPRWRAFGWAAAKTDDVANWVPARIAGGLIILAATCRGAGLRAAKTMFRDASKHASPNAGWTEAAMAGALGVRLGGPVFYDGVPSPRPQFGEGPQPTANDLGRGLSVYLLALVGLSVILLAGGALWRL